MTAKFRDVLQCIDGERKGLIAQVIDVTNGDVEMLHRPIEGAPNIFTLTSDDAESYWRQVGVARVGPKPKTLEPENASRPNARPGESSTPPNALPAPSPLAPLKIDELLAPLPSDMKAVPMNATPLWNVEEPSPTQDENKTKRRRMKANARNKNTIPSKTYSATVTNGAGDEARVTYSLRSDLEPKRFVAGAIIKARNVIPDVKPWKVEEIKEAP